VETAGPGANVAALPPRIVTERLTKLLAKVGPSRPAVCCAGSAGAEVPAARLRLEKLLAHLLPGSRICVVHDTRLILAAADLEEGIALIAGTGSAAYGRAADGREAQAGGWGWLVGDDGGGAWITREAVREVMRRVDAGRPPGPLGDGLLDACGARDPREMIEKMHRLHEPMQWAALASVVFDVADGDAAAQGVIQRAASELRGLVDTVRRRLSIDGLVVLAGGLLLNQPKLESAMRDELAGRCIRLEVPPVHGAVRLAEELLH
jgi:N-acetylglucosamine kinase-like BadF-type ATPase